MREYETILTGMQGKYRELAGFHPDDASDIGIRLKVLAYEIFSLEQALQDAALQADPLTATGSYLVRHAQCRGLDRKAAIAARGQVTFSRTDPVDYDILIPAGTLLSTPQSPAVSFVTLGEAVLPAGETRVQAEAQCESAGTVGNVAPGAVRLMVTPVAGIGAVVNEEGFFGGVPEESDEELRARLTDSLREVTNGTNAAFYRQQALSQEGIVSVKVLPCCRGTGTVDLAVWGAGKAPEQGQIAALQEHLSQLKEINVDIDVQAATPRPVDVTLQVAPKEGYSYEDVSARCQQALAGYFLQLPVGGALLLSQLGRAVMDCEGVYNMKIAQPSADQIPQKKEIITLGTVALSRLAVSEG